MQITEITVSVKKSWGRGKDKWGKKTWDGGEILLSSTASLGPTEDPTLARAKLYDTQKKQIISKMEQNNIVVQ